MCRDETSNQPKSYNSNRVKIIVFKVAEWKVDWNDGLVLKWIEKT
jgi:hypothetical protein